LLNDLIMEKIREKESAGPSAADSAAGAAGAGGAGGARKGENKGRRSMVRVLIWRLSCAEQRFPVFSHQAKTEAARFGGLRQVSPRISR
jgi:hypothetical protein